MAEQKSQRLHTCYHCGNTGLMNVEHVYTHEEGGPIFDEFDQVIDCVEREENKWYLLSCPVCGKATLFNEYTLEGAYCTEQNQLYPAVAIDADSVPKQIRDGFEAALKVKNLDAALCVLGLRRTLEAICKDKNAIGKSLDEMIKDLVDRKILPDMLTDACYIIRKLGNASAHADNLVFYQYEVEQSIQFIHAILQYLYVLPDDITRMKVRIDEKLSKKTDSDTVQP